MTPAHVIVRAPRAARVALAVAALACVATAHGARAGEAAPGEWSRDRALAYSQDALGREVRDLAFTTTDGRTVHLSDYRGRPLVLSLIYTSCYHVCPVLTTNLSRAVRIGRDALGADAFDVVTIGFDAPNDTPPRMLSFARERGIETSDWAFLSGDRESIRALAEDVGFVFFPTAKGFDHLAQTTIIDGSGQVYRQVYGADIDPPALVEPLKELALGQPASAQGLAGWIDGVRLFCTLYDPASGRYRFNYRIFAMLAAAVLSLGATLVFLVYAWRSGGGGRASH